jgi:hypothetical protein
MRSAILLFLLTLTASISTVYAEDSSVGDDVTAYCTEQGQLAGIEDTDELNQYVQDCVDSYAMPASE